MFLWIRAGLDGRGVWEHHLHCPEEWGYAETGTYVEDKFLEAMNDIQSEAVLPSGVQVNYRAGNTVHLIPGFHATQGVHFHAFIHPCDLPGNSFHPKNLAVASGSDVEDVSLSWPGLQLFPNPSSGNFTIQASFIPEEGIGAIRIYGSLGNLALTSSMQGPEQRINASGLHGLYMVMVECDGVQRTGKIFLE